ncbi:hypothetical protein ABZT17_09855 [Streptomyces sp. NPDC005648]|uniref:hypothetical protein n=1 Tax=Streptomyces sp. NPDC005648 TaxID=3157044 RepID=UPI0033AA2DD6
MLPAQINWARSLLSLNGVFLAVPDALRLITVSPVWLYGGKTGAAALGREALWLTLFLILLCTGAAALLRRLSTPRTVPLVSVFVLPLLAPAAHLITLLLMKTPQLMSYGTQGDALAETIEQAHKGTQHALLLGVAAGVTAAVTGRLAVQGPGRPEVSRHRFLLGTAAMARGPAGSLRRRIGMAMTSGLVCCLLLTLLDSQLVRDGAQHVAVPWCAGARFRSHCTGEIADAVLGGLPQRSNAAGSRPWNLYSLIRLYAYGLCFLAAAMVAYLLRTLPGLRARHSSLPLLFLRTWAAYFAGATCYGTIVGAAITLRATPRGISAHGLAATESLVLTNFVYSGGLHHALLAAPAAAALATLAAVLIRHTVPRRAQHTPTASSG